MTSGLTMTSSQTIAYFHRIEALTTYVQLLNCDLVMQLPKGTSFYGTGEVGGSVERTGKRVSYFSSQLHVAFQKKVHSGMVLFKGRILIPPSCIWCFFYRFIHGIRTRGVTTRTPPPYTSLIRGCSQYFQTVTLLEF